MIGWFTVAFLTTSLLLIIATLIWYGIIKILPLMYQTATRIEHLRLYHTMQKDVASICKDIGAGKVLDVGAGTGYLSLPLSKFHNVVALDASLDMLEYAKKVAKKRKSLIYPVVGMAEALPFKSQSFDLVVSSFALHHFSNLTMTLQEMMRVLKPEGHLILMDIAGGSLVSELHRVVTDQIFRMLSGQNWQGYYYLDFDILKQWLTQAGLKVKSMATYSHPLPRKLIHLVNPTPQIKIRPFFSCYRYRMGMSDEAKVMMFRAKVLDLKPGRLSSSGYYPLLVKPFLEILAGNLYLGKRLLTYGLQHFGINLSEHLISAIDTISFYTPTLHEEVGVATDRIKEFAMMRGCDMCGVLDMEYVREKTSVSLTSLASRAIVVGKSTLNLED
jgi:ubiquinone/menaquinone biosynthesis C-methylase UbiE